MNGTETQVIVRRQGGKWTVKVRELERVFADEAGAMNCAMQLAHESGKNGSPGVVLLHGEDATLKEIWAYGKDVLPPEGASARES